MKLTIIGMLTLLSVSSFASDSCIDRNSAIQSLQTAKSMNESYKECETFDCAKVASLEVQSWMCEASKSCKEIQSSLNYPCQQKIILTEDNYDASGYFNKMIRKSLRKIN